MLCSTFKTNCSSLLSLFVIIFIERRAWGQDSDGCVAYALLIHRFLSVTAKECETPCRIGQVMRLMVQEHSHGLGEQVHCALAMYTELSQDKQNSSRTSSWYIISPEIKKFQAEAPSSFLWYRHTLLRTPARTFFVVVCFAFGSRILLTNLVVAHQIGQERPYKRKWIEEQW